MASVPTLFPLAAITEWAADVRIEIKLIELERLRFGFSDRGSKCLRSGWSRPEATFVWSVDKESSVCCARPEGAFDVIVELCLRPFLAPSVLLQRLTVSINGMNFGWVTLEQEAFLAYRLRRAELDNYGEITITFHHPDAVSPHDLGVSSDTRHLAVALLELRLISVKSEPTTIHRSRPPLFKDYFSDSLSDVETLRAVTALRPAELMATFESLGINCAFGLVQRALGIEPLGLLRFAGLPYEQLLKGVKSEFAGLGAPGDLTCAIDGADPEYIVRSARYELSYHTYHWVSSTTPDHVLKEQSRILPFRREKLRDLFKTGEKLFVVHSPKGMSDAEILPLFLEIKRHGPGALLYVSDATSEPGGGVVTIEPGLFRGALTKGWASLQDERFDNRTWLSRRAVTDWLSICANAYRLWRESGGGVRSIA